MCYVFCCREKLHEANNELQKKRAIIEDLEPRFNNSCEFFLISIVVFNWSIVNILLIATVFVFLLRFYLLESTRAGGRGRGRENPKLLPHWA